MLCLIVVCSNIYSNVLSSDVFRLKLSLLAHTGAHPFTSHSKCNFVSSMMTGLISFAVYLSDLQLEANSALLTVVCFGSSFLCSSGCRCEVRRTSTLSFVRLLLRIIRFSRRLALVEISHQELHIGFAVVSGIEQFLWINLHVHLLGSLRLLLLRLAFAHSTKYVIDILTLTLAVALSCVNAGLLLGW